MTSSMSKMWLGLIFAGLGLLLIQGIAGSFAQEAEMRRATILTLQGPVTPASADYLTREIDAASARGDAFVVMEIDTPGGLVDSMKSIIKSILASETPVVTYVSPQGGRSASAGLYIMYAAHVSAMAPATNTGSATPIQMGGTSPVPGAEDEAPADISNEASLRGKIIEDSVAYIRGLAELRGRNADWAEKAVRPPSASVTATEALELGVIDMVADDLEDLLSKIEGRTVQVASGNVVIDTEGVGLTRVEPTLVEQVLGFFANPNVAAILLTLGTTGLIVELWNPGSIFPGAMGLLCLILAFYSFQVLPFQVVPLAIMGVGLVLIGLEAFTPSFGVVGTAGLTVFGVGLWFLFPNEFRVAPTVLFSSIAIAGTFLGLTLFAVVGSRSHGPLIGQEAIRRRAGRVDDWDGAKGEGHVIVDGERWRARSKDTLQAGDRIRVIDVDGIVLVVKKISSGSGSSKITAAASTAAARLGSLVSRKDRTPPTRSA